MTGDTIAAVSTAPGEGGIGVVRISGDRSLEIMGRVFVRVGSCGTDFAERTVYYGHIVEPLSAERVDEALVFFMKGPRSYTGEDVCEIQCHGGGVPLRRVLDIVCGLGAVPAQPGEFTKRAFLNGRLDLAQAGAVIDLIRSKTARGYHAAREQAEGRLSERVRAVREVLLGALAEIAARIDYPEGFEGDGGVGIGALRSAAEGVAALLDGAEAGRIVRDGVRVVIVGRPNVGKSSLFNALVREDAAIVAPTPGTTRDALEIWLDMGGVPVLLTDTAGMREGAEEIEALGIERAKEQYERADLAVFLLDGSEPLSEADRAIAGGLDPEKKHVVAIGKGDLPQAFGAAEAAAILPPEIEAGEIVRLSLIDDGQRTDKEKAGEIERRLEGLVMGGIAAGSSLLVTKARHKALLERAAAEIAEGMAALGGGGASGGADGNFAGAPEFAEVNIRAAWEALGEIIGETATDDIIDRVFEEFCVGK
ncbi:MAG: tRNA uridine-5-carboxymethylaminomethyl(34) synthesis GTPase MnmE [Clostridiales bacterium]|nr:tRNA uridine-5-carboxymethylaminomethyl(34) synthesis GTPase MnmE [Clostridiales bacterium]